eukprot:5976803-Pleurochrysis_carterae.AAC.1
MQLLRQMKTTNRKKQPGHTQDSESRTCARPARYAYRTSVHIRSHSLLRASGARVHSFRFQCSV